MELKEHKISINGLNINYVEGGTGEPIIFLHNGGGFWHSWEHQINYFAKNYKVFGIDWPGFGESDLPEGLISLQLLKETLKSFIAQKNLKDVILVGNCIGGSAALLYNMENPQLVKKLVVFNICPGDLIFGFPIMRPYVKYLSRKKRSKRLIGSFLAFIFTKTSVKKQFPKVLFGKELKRESPLFKRYERKFLLKSQTTSRVNMVFSVHTFNLLNYLDPDNIPKHLLVWGNQNRVTSLKDHGVYHHNLLKSEKFEVIQNAGHLCMYEAPEKVIDLIEDYIK